ncbi:MAG TPA: DUF3040 domain-containing protein [Actinocrinis sp.]|nr:DUF3040 domain-containing protein [Actinocrinis sp.]
MPLTQHEQRILTYVEQDLAAHNPRLARLLAAPGPLTRALHGPYRALYCLISVFALAVGAPQPA